MARGGKRQPDPAKAGQYANRSDMRTTQPVQTTSGGVYGSVAEQEAQQAAQPLQNASGATAAMGAQEPSVYPGDLGAFDRPTDRPDEPVTQGIPIGAGAGPEALQPGGPSFDLDSANAEDIAAMADQLPTLETLASMPGSSAGMRNFVRRLRSAAPTKPLA